MTSISGERPEAYVAEDRRRALATGADLADHVTGAGLFVDISGFTPLTEALVAELGPRRGAERLSDTLDRVFARLLASLHEHGGSVVYFSGDAVTCWIDGDDGALAVACGLDMQHALAEVADIALPSGATVRLAMKVTVAVGRARRFVVGDPRVQLIDVLAGRLVEELAEAEAHAGRGEVLIAPSAAASLGARVAVAEQRVDAVTGARYAVVTGLPGGVDLPPDAGVPPELPESISREWLLPVVYERMRTGRGEFLAELRTAVPLFLRFGGIDFDDPDAPRLLDEFIVAAQRIIDSYGGNALQLTIGDKGAYLYGVFGSPIAHEDDSARACAAALELAELDRQGQIGDIRIGISRGRLRSGTYGHASRRTFCCLGDAVNLAARLMAKAPSGGIYVADDVLAATGALFDWQQLEPLQVKGKAEPVAAGRLLGRRAHGALERYGDRRMVGRDDELATVAKRIRLALDGRGQLVGVTAEAGMGKSRLVAAAAELLDAQGVSVVSGAAPTFGATGNYQAWQHVWATLLGVDSAADRADVRRRLNDVVGGLDTALLPRAPLLGAVVGVSVADNDLTAGLDAKLRKTSTEFLLVELLARMTEQRGPLAIVIEDCSSLDPLSADLMVVMARAIETLPVVLLLAYRPLSRREGTSWHTQLSGAPNVTELALTELPEPAARQVVLDRYSDVFGNSAAPGGLVDLVLAAAEGNPFHIEEMLNFVASKGIDPADRDALATLEVPDTLDTLVLSRIDVLPESPRRTVKVASVVGREVDIAMLLGTYPPLGTSEDAHRDLDELTESELMVARAEDLYLFRHAVIRDVAYDSLPFAMRETLHANAGAYLERIGGDEAEQRYLDLLAHHYWLSADDARKRHYLLLAADSAHAAYANSTAIDYYRRALTLISEQADKADVLLRLGRVLERVGDWVDADSAYRQAFELAELVGDRALRASARAASAEVSRKQGDYDAAARELALAEREFAEIDDDSGLGQVLHWAGTLAAQQGDYELARDRWETSLAIRRRHGDVKNEASMLSNLAIIAEYAGDYDTSRALNEQALELRLQTGDRWAIGISQNNLGMIASLQGEYEQARSYLAEALRLHHEVGDLWMVALERDTLGNALCRLGRLDEAGHEYAESYRGYRMFDEKWGVAILIEDVAGLAAARNDHRAALMLEGAAGALRESLGSPRAPSQVEALDATLRPARESLGPDAEASAASGAALATDEVGELVFAVCEPARSRSNL